MYGYVNGGYIGTTPTMYAIQGAQNWILWGAVDPLTPGTYNWQVRVQDQKGLSNSYTGSIEVLPPL